MEGKQLAQDLFTFAEKNAKEDPNENKKQLYGRFLTINDSVSVTSIKWENVGYSNLNRYIR